MDVQQYLDKDAKPFDLTLLVGSKNADGSFGLYLIKNNAMVYPKYEYQAIGSGGDLARVVIKQLNRSMDIVGGSLHKMSAAGVVKAACYIINEVKDSDSQSGGQTRVVMIDSNGVRELSPEEVRQNYDEFLIVIAVGYSRIFQGLSIEQIKKMWPTG